MFICYLLPRPDPGLSNVLGAVDCLPSVGRSIRNARFSYTGRPGRAGTTEKRYLSNYLFVWVCFYVHLNAPAAIWLCVGGGGEWKGPRAYFNGWTHHWMSCIKKSKDPSKLMNGCSI